MTLSSESKVRGYIVFACVVGLATYALWMVRGVVVLLYVSALFAVVLTPVVHATSSIHIGRWRPFRGSVAILILLLLVAGALTGFGFLAIPPVVHDLQSLNGELPTRVPALLTKVREIPFADRLNSNGIIGWVKDASSHVAAFLLLSVKQWASDLVQVITAFVLTLYFIIEGEAAYHWILSFIAPLPRGRLDDALRATAVRMQKWLLGQASLMLILGIASTIAYLALGMRYAFALGVLTGLLNVIPVLGATISFVIAVLVAVMDSWGRVLGVAIFFAAYMQIENSFLIPRIMQNRVDLPALGIFVALLFGFTLEGIPGAMVAVPTAVLVAVLLDEYLVHKEEAFVVSPGESAPSEAAK